MSSKRYIFHVDANSAYLSWEAVHRLQHGDALDLRTVPAVVGGDPKTRHGIVLTKSIPAKKYNIQTGETIYSAVQKCPGLIVVLPNYGLYRQCSDSMVEILREYSPMIQRFSVDECFMDFSIIRTYIFYQKTENWEERIILEKGLVLYEGTVEAMKEDEEIRTKYLLV